MPTYIFVHCFIITISDPETPSASPTDTGSQGSFLACLLCRVQGDIKLKLSYEKEKVL